MTYERQDVSFTDTGLRARGVGSTTYRPTSAADEVAELRVDDERPAATADRSISACAAGADEVAATRMTALYGIHRDDGMWVTECAWCKRVRNVAGDWQTLSRSARSAIRAERTHGICSECADSCLAQAVDR